MILISKFELLSKTSLPNLFQIMRYNITTQYKIKTSQINHIFIKLCVLQSMFRLKILCGNEKRQPFKILKILKVMFISNERFY